MGKRIRLTIGEARAMAGEWESFHQAGIKLPFMGQLAVWGHVYTTRPGPTVIRRRITRQDAQAETERMRTELSAKRTEALALASRVDVRLALEAAGAGGTPISVVQRVLHAWLQTHIPPRLSIGKISLSISCGDKVFYMTLSGGRNGLYANALLAAPAVVDHLACIESLFSRVYRDDPPITCPDGCSIS